MSFDSNYWMGQTSGVLIVYSIICIARNYLTYPNNCFQRILSAYREYIGKSIRFLQIPTSVIVIINVQIACLCLSVIIFLITINWLILILIPFMVFTPYILLKRYCQKRTTRIEEQLDTWLAILANALKGSSSLGEALYSSTGLIYPPLSQEVDLLIKEYRLGTPLDQAMDNMEKRIGSRTVASALLILRVARNSGGDMISTLRESAESLRELARLEGIARTKTAEGRAQALVIGVIPFPLFGSLHWINSGFLDPVFETFKGNLILVGAVILWLLAILIARKVLIVEI